MKAVFFLVSLSLCMGVDIVPFDVRLIQLVNHGPGSSTSRSGAKCHRRLLNGISDNLIFVEKGSFL